MKMKLKHKLVALFMVISILPLSIVGWLTYQRTTHVIETLQYEKLSALAEKRADRINELIAQSSHRGAQIFVTP